MDKYFTENKSQGDEEFFDPENRTENLSFSEHMQEMKTGEKAKYIKDYVLLPVLVVLFVAAFVFIVVYLQYKSRTVDVLYIHINNPETVDTVAVKNLSENLYSLMGLEKSERIYFDTMPYSEEEELQIKKTRDEAETIRQYAGVRNSQDISIGKLSDFKEDYENGSLFMLSEVLDAETAEKVKEKMLPGNASEGADNTANETPWALCLTGTLFEDCVTGETVQMEDCVMVFYKSGAEKEEYNKRVNELISALMKNQ